MEMMNQSQGTMKRQSIKSKMQNSFLIVLLLMALSGVVSIGALLKVGADYKNAINNYSYSMGYAGQLNGGFNNMIALVKDIILEEDPAEQENINARIKEQVEADDVYLQQIRDAVNTAEEQAICEDIDGVLNDYRAIRDHVVELGAQNRNEEAYELMMTEGKPLATKIKADIDQILAINMENCEKTTKNANTLSIIMVSAIIAFTVIAMIIGFTLSARLSKGICVPLREMVEAAGKLAQGDLNVEIRKTTNDEIGELAGSLAFMVGNLRVYIDTIAEVTSEMAGYNLQTSIDMDFLGSFAKIKDAVNHFVGVLNEAVGTIKVGASEVANGSEQVAKGAQDLAEGTSTEASVTQELNATVTDVSEKVDKNAQDAVEAGRLAEVAQLSVETGTVHMAEMVEAMEEIKSSNNEIQGISKVIEDIASQTNLLSLNASIEAARAGDAGRGFAVVAGEIGTLAAQSAEATKNIAELIQRCIVTTEKGMNKVEATSASLQDVKEKAGAAGMLIKNIADACGQQADALKEVVNGINQVTDTVQANSAISEESAALSEELTSQANILSQTVARFRIRE